MADPWFTDADVEAMATALTGHHPTRGMAVSMGTTCECGYWTGSEPEAGKRPLPWGRDGLDLHRARVMLHVIAPRIAQAQGEFRG